MNLIDREGWKRTAELRERYTEEEEEVREELTKNYQAHKACDGKVQALVGPHRRGYRHMSIHSTTYTTEEKC